MVLRAGVLAAVIGALVVGTLHVQGGRADGLAPNGGQGVSGASRPGDVWVFGASMRARDDIVMESVRLIGATGPARLVDVRQMLTGSQCSRGWPPRFHKTTPLAGARLEVGRRVDAGVVIEATGEGRFEAKGLEYTYRRNGRRLTQRSEGLEVTLEIDEGAESPCDTGYNAIWAAPETVPATEAMCTAARAFTGSSPVAGAAEPRRPSVTADRYWAAIEVAVTAEETGDPMLRTVRNDIGAAIRSDPYDDAAAARAVERALATCPPKPTNDPQVKIPYEPIQG